MEILKKISLKLQLAQERVAEMSMDIIDNEMIRDAQMAEWREREDSQIEVTNDGLVYKVTAKK